MHNPNLSGTWLSRYMYASGSSPEIHVSEHLMNVETEGTQVLATSQPQADGSEVTLRLDHNADDQMLTGTWQEKTSPGGHYKGAVLYGALQLILNNEGTAATGSWVGFNSDRTQVKSGEWRLEKQE